MFENAEQNLTVNRNAEMIGIQWVKAEAALFMAKTNDFCLGTTLLIDNSASCRGFLGLPPSIKKSAIMSAWCVHMNEIASLIPFPAYYVSWVY